MNGSCDLVRENVLLLERLSDHLERWNLVKSSVQVAFSGLK
jgi:hypothetical protein